MKNTVRPATQDCQPTQGEQDALNVLSRIKLALLDEHTCERRGYDPYDTSKDRTRDVWSAKRKRA